MTTRDWNNTIVGYDTDTQSWRAYIDYQSGDTQESVRELLVRAANAHDELVTALEAFVDGWNEDKDGRCLHCGAEQPYSGETHAPNCKISKARAAIAQATKAD